jgi:hypothetical protein
VRSAARVLVLATAILSSGSAREAVVYDPDPSHEGAGELTGETWGKIGPTSAIRLTRIDDATRTRFIRTRSGLETDPFANAPDRAPGFFSFHVLVENLTETRMVFQPQACRLITSWMDSSGPIDLPTIMTAFAINDRKPPENIERIRGAIIDGELILGPGEKRDGLLVYKAIDPKTKRYQVDVVATLTDGKPFGFSAFYKKRKPKP